MSILTDERARWLARQVLPHEPALRSWLACRRVPQLEVDDVVQETYAILAGLDSVAHVRNAKAYVFQTARSVLLQHVRRSRIVSIESVGALEDLQFPADAVSPEQETASRQEFRRLVSIVATLPSKCRQAFVLSKIDGLSQREVSMRMGVSESTVEKHVSKGLHIVMDEFGRAGLRDGAAPSGKIARQTSKLVADENGPDVRAGAKRRY